MVRSRVHDEIGPWTEIKNEIIEKYAGAYTKILRKRHWCRGTYYVDAFAGAQLYTSRESRQRVPGSTSRALAIDPPFSRYIFNDLDKTRAEGLMRLAEARDDVEVHNLDGNEFLLHQVVPRLPYHSFKRGLVLIDPYKMDLRWETVLALAEAGTVDVILNFPIMDMNRNALRKQASQIEPADAARMIRWWGDESWRGIVYPNRQMGLFGDEEAAKSAHHRAVADAYSKRLQEVAKFAHVGKPLLMRNRTNAPLYYLMFASQKDVAVGIINDIFRRYR